MKDIGDDYCRFRVSRVRVCGTGLLLALRLFKLISFNHIILMYIIQLKVHKEFFYTSSNVKTHNVFSLGHLNIKRYF